MSPDKQIEAVNRLLIKQGNRRFRFSPDAARELHGMMAGWEPAPSPRCRDSDPDDTAWLLAHQVYHGPFALIATNPFSKVHSEKGWYIWSGYTEDMGGLNGPVDFNADVISLPNAIIYGAFMSCREFVQRRTDRDANAMKASADSFTRCCAIMSKAPWSCVTYI